MAHIVVGGAQHVQLLVSPVSPVCRAALPPRPLASPGNDTPPQPWSATPLPAAVGRSAASPLGR